MELSQRLEHFETQTTNNNDNTTMSTLKDVSGLPLNTIIQLNSFNEKISADEVFRSNLVRKSYNINIAAGVWMTLWNTENIFKNTYLCFLNFQKVLLY